MNNTPPPSVIAIGGNHAAIVSARVAKILNGYLRPLRIELRGRDSELDATLLALAYTAMTIGSESGTTIAATPEPAAELSQHQMNTTQAAKSLGISPRAVTKSIQQGRLKAEQVDGRWRVDRNDVEHYQATHNRKAHR